jgi:hypothetical protein
MIAEGCLLIFYGQSLYVGELQYDRMIIIYRYNVVCNVDVMF